MSGGSTDGHLATVEAGRLTQVLQDGRVGVGGRTLPPVCNLLCLAWGRAGDFRDPPGGFQAATASVGSCGHSPQRHGVSEAAVVLTLWPLDSDVQTSASAGFLLAQSSEAWLGQHLGKVSLTGGVRPALRLAVPLKLVRRFERVVTCRFLSQCGPEDEGVQHQRGQASDCWWLPCASAAPCPWAVPRQGPPMCCRWTWALLVTSGRRP